MSSPVRHTPIVRCPELGASFKLENLQRTGSFKLRGAWRKLASLGVEERARGVVTASAGNHGAGLSLAAHELGVAARVVVPEGTPEIKRQRIASM
ncbi:MAG: pyridoxal-phosphate dependent enzyme, partial [Deltaproteobacteria bacterium]|nr:pyridoxal-phosphate dependent enzyme [Deltaproteobacteria bacterium]